MSLKAPYIILEQFLSAPAMFVKALYQNEFLLYPAAFSNTSASTRRIPQYFVRNISKCTLPIFCFRIALSIPSKLIYEGAFKSLQNSPSRILKATPPSFKLQLLP